MDQTNIRKENILESNSLHQVHPWRRYFARIIDLSILSVLITLVYGYSTPKLIKGLIDIYTILKFMVYLVVDIILLSVFGTTPGKWLFNITLKRNDGLKLSFEQILKREVMVWIYGYGLHIPIVSLLTMLKSVSDLEGRGITKWDEKLELSLTHGTLTTMRRLVCVLVIIAVPAFTISMQKMGII